MAERRGAQRAERVERSRAQQQALTARAHKGKALFRLL